AWAKNGTVEVAVSEQDKSQLEAVLFDGIKDELKQSIYLRVSSDVSNGFRIGLKDNQVYYDFSDESIAEVLKSLINPKLKAILEQ
ncbi:MAG: V-type ATP synthase subunit E, partial [candidate division KSB1 bacterium]|nr:V-type ATP synthase subunit E [candidate division KSB1 bacterium]